MTDEIEKHRKLSLQKTPTLPVRDGMPRKVLDGHNLGPLTNRLSDLAELTESDQELVSQIIDGLLAKSRLKVLAGGLAEPRIKKPS